MILSRSWGLQAAAKVATQCRTEPGDLCAGTRMAWSDDHLTSGECRIAGVARSYTYALA